MEKSCIICFDENPLIPHINTFCREPKTEKYCSCDFYIHSLCLRRYLKQYGDECTICKKQIMLKQGIVKFKDDLIFITVDNEIYKSLDDNDDDNSTINTQVITEPICSNEQKQILITIILSILIIMLAFYLMS